MKEKIKIKKGEENEGFFFCGFRLYFMNCLVVGGQEEKGVREWL